jgi:hypothetical protein
MNNVGLNAGVLDATDHLQDEVIPDGNFEDQEETTVAKFDEDVNQDLETAFVVVVPSAFVPSVAFTTASELQPLERVVGLKRARLDLELVTALDHNSQLLHISKISSVTKVLSEYEELLKSHQEIFLSRTE